MQEERVHTRFRTLNLRFGHWGAGRSAVGSVAIWLASCTLPSSLPDPPPAVVESVPPGADDFALGKFGYPLSVTDAQMILTRTQVFAFGNWWRQVQAFNVLFDHPGAATRFEALARVGAPAGKLYAFCALSLANPTAADALASQLSSDTSEIVFISSDVAFRKSSRDALIHIKAHDVCAEMRAERDRINDHYSKAR